MRVLVPGARYRHYTGKDYQVIGSARHSETLEELVVYKALYGDGEMWARPRTMFLEAVEIKGERKLRFAYVGKVEADDVESPQ